MQVGAGVEEAELKVIAAAIPVVSDMDGLMHVLEEMDGELQSFLLLFPVGIGVQQDPPEVLDLADNAALRPAQPGIVPGLGYRNVHVVPGSGARNLRLWIRPGGNLGQAFAGLK